MYLIINNQFDALFLGLRDSKQQISKSETKKMDFGAGEKLLFLVHNFLKKNKINITKIKGIIINRGQGSFTSLRLTSLLANAWAYANKIPLYSLNTKIKPTRKVYFLEPIYGREPNISQPKNKIC